MVVSLKSHQMFFFLTCPSTVDDHKLFLVLHDESTKTYYMVACAWMVALRLCNNCRENKGLPGKSLLVTLDKFTSQAVCISHSKAKWINKPQICGDMEMPTKPCHCCNDLTKMPNHDGENWMIIQSTATLVFCCFWSLWVRFNWIPHFRQRCRESPVCQDKSKPSVTKVDGFGLDMGLWTWACALHADRCTHRHTCAFWNYVKPRQNGSLTCNLSTPLNYWFDGVFGNILFAQINVKMLKY